MGAVMSVVLLGWVGAVDDEHDFPGRAAALDKLVSLRRLGQRHTCLHQQAQPTGIDEHHRWLAAKRAVPARLPVHRIHAGRMYPDQDLPGPGLGSSDLNLRQDIGTARGAVRPVT
jgi:hypothetical protein